MIPSSPPGHFFARTAFQRKFTIPFSIAQSAMIPSEVLFRRPDIAEAEYRAKAANKIVKAAYTGYYPSLILNGTAGFQSPTLQDFMKWISRYWMLGAQSDQLVFDGFRTPYDIQFQIARFKEAGGEYQQQVLVAFQEVEDALTNLDLYAREYNTGVTTTEWAQIAYQIYSDRYELGVINYIDVVITERSLLNLQIAVNALQGYRFMATVQLLKALGGGWSIDQPETLSCPCACPIVSVGTSSHPETMKALF
jgi:multidrug efflux system outer membrane protein